MFRRLPPQGGTLREVSEVVNGVLNGKTNNTGTVTLGVGGATSTVINDERISPDSKIIIIPFSAAANDDTAPFGEFANTTDQTSPSAGSTALVAWDTTITSNGTSISDTNRINVLNGGKYSVSVSLQLQNINNNAQYADIWFRKNGVDVPNSGRRFFMPARKSASEPSHVVGFLVLYADMAANDYVQVADSVSSTDVSLEHFVADGAIPRPAIPAALAYVEYISPHAYSDVYITSQTFGQATISHFANSVVDKTYAYVVVG